MLNNSAINEENIAICFSFLKICMLLKLKSDKSYNISSRNNFFPPFFAMKMIEDKNYIFISQGNDSSNSS